MSDQPGTTDRPSAPSTFDFRLPTPVRINADRLHESLHQLCQIGATPGGGVTRLALSDEDRTARDLLRRWMEEAGLSVRVDDFGNMTGRRRGAESGAAVVLASHIDSVRRGGRYDGAYGVLAALEVMRALNDAGVTTRKPLELVNWTNEEGVRFEPAMLASGAVAGRFHPRLRLRTHRPRWEALRRRAGADRLQGRAPATVPAPSPPTSSCTSSRDPCWRMPAFRSAWWRGSSALPGARSPPRADPTTPDPRRCRCAAMPWSPRRA